MERSKVDSVKSAKVNTDEQCQRQPWFSISLLRSSGINPLELLGQKPLI